MAQDPEVAVTADSLIGQPNTVVDFEDDILNNEHAGEDAESLAKAQNPANVSAPLNPGAATLERLLEQLVRIAGAGEAREQRAESIRQIPYAEIKPDSPFNPEGRRDRVRLKRATSQHGIPLNPLNLWEEEIVLLNKLKPGRYIDRKVEVRMTQEGAIDISWPGGKNDARIEMYSRFPTLISLLTAVIAEREEKEAKRRRGVFSEDEAVE